ncbi:microaggregate invasion protein 1 [Mycobacteroides abscessus]|uniref:microaggregate invasion protein 1 n=1 Tax=Mycobacteroides abscessus TaxID=36809 RepID=UPI004024BA8D
MAYEYEAEEWRAATHTMTEMERATAAVDRRSGLGMVGDRDDALDELRCDR